MGINIVNSLYSVFVPCDVFLLSMVHSWNFSILCLIVQTDSVSALHERLRMPGVTKSSLILSISCIICSTIFVLFAKSGHFPDNSLSTVLMVSNCNLLASILVWRPVLASWTYFMESDMVSDTFSIWLIFVRPAWLIWSMWSLVRQSKLSR